MELGITDVHIKLRGARGNKTYKAPGPGAQSALRALARYGMRIGRIGKVSSMVIFVVEFIFAEDVTPIPADSTCVERVVKRKEAVSAFFESRQQC